MKNKRISSKEQSSQICMMVDGHQVTCTFTEEPNPNLSALIRNTLLDSYIRRIGLNVDEPTMDAHSILSECAACQ